MAKENFNTEKLIKTLDEIQKYMEGMVYTVSYKGGYIDVTAADFDSFKKLIPFYIKNLPQKTEEIHRELFPFYKVIAVLPPGLLADFISSLPDQNTTNFLKSLIEALAEQKAEEKLKQITQGELFPLFKPQKTVELQKEFALNFGGLERIRKDYKHLLKRELTSGKTFAEHLENVENWYNSLHGENLGNWIKICAYTKAVKEYADNHEYVNFREPEPGRYCFSIKQDKNFFQFFIRRDKKSGQFTTKTKKHFLRWLYDNRNSIEFPMINEKGEVWDIPIRIYEYAENVSTKEIFFTINTNILDSIFKDYISIEISEIDNIDELWETTAAKNKDFKKYRLNSFIDIPLKFLLTLKQIYNPAGDFTNEDFKGNAQRLTAEGLNTHLGNLKERIKKHLQQFRAAGEKSKIANTITALLLDTTWEIAMNRKWLLSKPFIDKGTWHFNINPGAFAKKTTAKRLQTP